MPGTFGCSVARLERNTPQHVSKQPPRNSVTLPNSRADAVMQGLYHFACQDILCRACPGSRCSVRQQGPDRKRPCLLPHCSYERASFPKRELLQAARGAPFPSSRASFLNACCGSLGLEPCLSCIVDPPGWTTGPIKSLPMLSPQSHSLQPELHCRPTLLDHRSQ